MKIVQVCQRYYPEIGGIETHVKEISERLVKNGHNVEVLCTDPTGKLQKKETINEVRVIRFRSIAYKDAFFLAPQIYFYLRSKTYDCIHIHNYHAFPALLATLACRDFIFTPHYHGGSHSKIKNLLYKPYKLIGGFIFKKANKIVCVSKFEMELIRNHFKINNNKLVFIPNGLNLEEFNNVEPIRREHRTILYVGRLEKYKGVHHIISTLSMLYGYRLEIIGKGPYKKNLLVLAEKLNVSDRIDWLSGLARSDLLLHYKSADVFINLSRFEAYGITVAEALASGTPCVVAMGSALDDFIDGEGCVGISHPVDLTYLTNLIKGRKRVKPKKLPDWQDIVSELLKEYFIPETNKTENVENT